MQKLLIEEKQARDQFKGIALLQRKKIDA